MEKNYRKLYSIKDKIKSKGAKALYHDEFILGRLESGRGFKATPEIYKSILSLGDDVIVIDPEQEYEKFIKKLNS